MRTPRAWRLAATVAMLAVLAGPALPGLAGTVARAHAQLVASSPGPGTTLPESPDELRLIFSEPLEAQLTSLDVVDAGGVPIVERAGVIDADDPFALVLPAVDLADGTYTVTWRTLSAADGHTAEGFFTFAVGNTAEPMPAGTASTHAERDPIDVVGRWLTYLGLLLALGGAVIQRVVLRTGPMSRATARGLALGLVVAAAATLGMAVANGLEAGGIVEYLVGTRNGVLQLARAAVAAAGAIALAVVPPSVRVAAAGVTGLVGIVLLVAAGHAAALPGPVPVLVGVTHVAGAAVWISGIATLVVAAVRPSAFPPISELVPRFSALALVSIGMVGLTGVYSAWTQTGVLLDPGTEYGRTLLAKTSLAAAALAIGGLNYLDGGRMRRWVGGMRSRLTLEAAGAAGVLLLAAVLATTPPAEEAPGVPIAALPDAFGAVTPGMSMTLSPGRPGLNRIVVSTTDAMAMTSGALELGLDRLDTGASTRVPLHPEGMAGMDHGGMPMGGDSASADGTASWIADAVILPAGSRWDTSVRVLGSSGAELARQRFAFALSDERVSAGRAAVPLDLTLGVAAVLVTVGALGIGVGLGGGRLPRCERAASRWALSGGGIVGVLIGASIGIERLFVR